MNETFKFNAHDNNNIIQMNKRLRYYEFIKHLKYC
jgi:hypothetical protein